MWLKFMEVEKIPESSVAQREAVYQYIVWYHLNYSTSVHTNYLKIQQPLIKLLEKIYTKSLSLQSMEQYTTSNLMKEYGVNPAKFFIKDRERVIRDEILKGQ